MFRQLATDYYSGTFPRYVLAGMASFGANLALAALFHEGFGLDENVAAALSLTGVFMLNFALARSFIWRDSGNWRRQLVRFGVISASARLGEYLLFFILHNAAGINYLAALATAQGISFVAKFFLYGKFAFNAEGAASRTERDRTHFNRIAERYHRKDLNPGSRAARKLRLEQTLRLIEIPADAVLLEAGCGAGFAADYLSGRYAAYLGVDHSEELIGFARVHNGAANTRFDVADIEDFHTSERFDAVFMIGLLHHLESPARALATLARLVKPGGWVVANEPQSGNPLVGLSRTIRKRIDRAYSNEQTAFSRREMRAIFEQAGFTEVRIRPQGVFSTPFAEVTMPLQPVVAPLAGLACLTDRVLEGAAAPLLIPIAWNLIAAGRVA